MENIRNTNKFIQKRNISEELMIYIKQQILDGEIHPGDRIIETKFAKELGISQTPVREALRQLQGEGIITIIPNKGPIVTPLDRRAVFETYSIRSMLEGLAIRLVTKHASEKEIQELEDFYLQMKNKLHNEKVQYLLQDSFYIHEKIVLLSNHSRLITMYKSISFHIALANRMIGTKFSKQKEVDMHWELIEAIKTGDPDAAEHTMRKHIYRSYMEFEGFFAEAPEDPKDADEKLWF